MQAADLASSSRIVLAIVRLCWEAKNLPELNTQLSALSKKHGQLRQVSQRMVEQAVGYLDELKGAERLALIETLRDVTEGKAGCTARLR